MGKVQLTMDLLMQYQKILQSYLTTQHFTRFDTSLLNLTHLVIIIKKKKMEILYFKMDKGSGMKIEIAKNIQLNGYVILI